MEYLEGQVKDLLEAINATDKRISNTDVTILLDEFTANRRARGAVPPGLPKKLNLDEMKGTR